jgi:hypothetical protein
MRTPPCLLCLVALSGGSKKQILRILRLSVAFLAFPLMGSSCETLDSNAGLSPEEIAQRQRIQAKYGHIDAIRSGRIHSIPDSNQQVAANAASIQSIRSISNPNQRAAANRAWAQSMVDNLNASMHGSGMSQSQINQMAYQSNYDAARRRGMTPSEADAEARQFQQMWQQWSR